jgi:ribosome modulation factor
MNAPKDFRTMTADTIGKDLLSGLVTELRLLPKPWPELPKGKQDDIIDRLRARVETNVKMAVHLLAAQGRTVVTGDLDAITIKDGVKATVKFSSAAPNLHELYDANGKAVLVVVANAADHLGGINEVQGEADQRAMNLGNEYDPKGDGKGMGNTVDGEATAITDQNAAKHTMKERQEAWDAGYQAAMDGKTQHETPAGMAAELVKEWLNGWMTWQEEKGVIQNPPKSAKLGELPNEHGVYTCVADETFEWNHKKNSVFVELLELENGKWLYAINKTIGAICSTAALSLYHGVAESRIAALQAVQAKLIVSSAKTTLKGAALYKFTEFVDGLVDNEEEGRAA